MTRQHFYDRSNPDLALRTAGEDTGWWDENGQPAPWPEDFWHGDGTINPAWSTAALDPSTGTSKENDDTDEPPF